MTTKIGIITGSTRDARVNTQVAEYLLAKTKELNIEDAAFEIVDIKEFNLPELNENVPPAMGFKDFNAPEAKAWSDKMDSLDGFVFVTPEYNKNISPSLQNALSYLSPELANKAASIVSYGSTLGVAANFVLRTTLSNFNTAVVGPFGAFSLFTDFEEMSTFRPSDVHNPTIQNVLETTVAWSKALKTVRQ